MDKVIDRKRITFTDRLRGWFKWLLDPLGAFFNRLGIHPNMMTLLGLLGTSFGAYLIARGQLTWGGLLILLTVPFDALDGTMARLRNQATGWGAFVDSVTDRYSELVTYLGLLIYYLSDGNKLACILVFIAAAGSVLVPYTKAKADALNYDANVGLATRAERYIILAPALVFHVQFYALLLLAFITNITALQRIYHVRQQAYAGLKKTIGE